jgi:hypothetical protein
LIGAAMKILWITYILSALLLCTCLSAEDDTQYFDMNLEEKGEDLFQTQIDNVSGGEPPTHYILKYVFPAASTTHEENDGTVKPSILSSDSKYRLFGNLGQFVSGTSEDAPNFNVKLGFFASPRKSIFRARKITTHKNPVVIRRTNR